MDPNKPNEEVIPPKPTTYRNITFRSRLEARWAVCLDWYTFISKWVYEPEHYKYEDWTPDFFFATGYLRGLIEVKPTMPSADYIANLATAAKSKKLAVLVGYCDFYNGVPRIGLPCTDGKLSFDTPITESSFFPRISQAVSIAANYRFDLADQPTPPWRQPLVGEFEGHLSRWAQTERKANLRKRKHTK